jgi:hypothetical protein
MLATFFDSQSIIHKEFIPPGQTLNEEYYIEVLSLSVRRIRRVSLRKEEAASSRYLFHNKITPPLFY